MNKKGITVRQPMNKLERDEIFGKISRATKWMVNRYVLGTHPQTCLPPFIYLFIENLFCSIWRCLWQYHGVNR